MYGITWTVEDMKLLVPEEDIDVYDELKTDLMMYVSPGKAEDIINWLNRSGLLDYDVLKEYYLDDDSGDAEFLR